MTMAYSAEQLRLTGDRKDTLIAALLLVALEQRGEDIPMPPNQSALIDPEMQPKAETVNDLTFTPLKISKIVLRSIVDEQPEDPQLPRAEDIDVQVTNEVHLLHDIESIFLPFKVAFNDRLHLIPKERLSDKARMRAVKNGYVQEYRWYMGGAREDPFFGRGDRTEVKYLLTETGREIMHYYTSTGAYDPDGSICSIGSATFEGGNLSTAKVSILNTKELDNGENTVTVQRVRQLLDLVQINKNLPEMILSVEKGKIGFSIHTRSPELRSEASDLRIIYNYDPQSDTLDLDDDASELHKKVMQTRFTKDQFLSMLQLALLIHSSRQDEE
jgi:hypothetical protein